MKKENTETKITMAPTTDNDTFIAKYNNYPVVHDNETVNLPSVQTSSETIDLRYKDTGISATGSVGCKAAAVTAIAMAVAYAVVKSSR